MTVPAPAPAPADGSSAPGRRVPTTLRGDLTGGLVAAVVALPLAVAFGVQSGLGAEAGLYGAIAAGFVAAVLGGTRTQVTGPTGPMTVVSASLVSLAVARAGDVESALGIILLTFAVAGLFQVVFGLLGVARYVRYFPYPVVSGFMSGVGVIIVALQIWPFLGLSSPSSTWEIVRDLPTALTQADLAAVGIGSATIAAFVLLPRLTPLVPPVLGALIAGTLAALVLGLDVPVIGDIPQGLPELQIGTMLAVQPEHLWLILEYGLILAVLGAIDSLLTSVIADNLTKTRHDPNRELIGQGFGNLVAAFIGGLPSAGATKRTVVNIDAGGTTRLSGASHAVMLFAMLLGAGALVADVPLAVLAGILIPVGVGLVDRRGLAHLRDLPRADGAVMLLVLGITVFGDLIVAVVVGVLLACVLFMKRVADLGEQRTAVHALDATGAPTTTDAAHGEVFLVEVEGPLFFGSVATFRDVIGTVPAQARAVAIDLSGSAAIDQSGIYALEEAVLDLERRGVAVLLVGVEPAVADVLRRLRLIGDLLDEQRLTDDVATALRRAHDLTPVTDPRNDPMTDHDRIPTITADRQAATTPRAALETLRRGNERFVSGEAGRLDLRAMARATADGQHPIAAVVGCIDSRVAPETVFDLGPGSAFVLRTAGTVIDDTVIGGLEFATAAAGAPLVLVLTHTGCGAIQGACDGVELGHLTGVLSRIRPAVDATRATSSSHDDPTSLADRVAVRHALDGVGELLARSELLRGRAEAGSLLIAAATYDLAEGRVRWLEGPVPAV